MTKHLRRVYEGSWLELERQELKVVNSGNTDGRPLARLNHACIIGLWSLDLGSLSTPRVPLIRSPWFYALTSRL